MIEVILVVASFFIGYKIGVAVASLGVREAINRGYLLEVGSSKSGLGEDAVGKSEPEPEPKFRSHATCDACGIGSYIGTEVQDVVPKPWYCASCVPDNCRVDPLTRV